MTDSNSPDPVATPTRLIVYGTSWCGDCHRTRRFLDQNAIPYEWIDADKDENGMRRVLEINHGMRSVPTVVFPDGSVLTEPSNGQLARKLAEYPPLNDVFEVLLGGLDVDCLVHRPAEALVEPPAALLVVDGD